jgi:hypothetical protein
MSSNPSSSSASSAVSSNEAKEESSVSSVSSSSSSSGTSSKGTFKVQKIVDSVYDQDQQPEMCTWMSLSLRSYHCHARVLTQR